MQPIPMRLHCPECRELHIDQREFATKPHHTHACQHCGNVWRPAVVPTVGVRFLPGFKDDAPAPTPNSSADEEQTNSGGTLHYGDPIALARYTINKYGASSDKPSVHLAGAVLDAAHQRDKLRDQFRPLVAELSVALGNAIHLIAGTNTPVDHNRITEWQILCNRAHNARTW